MVAASPRHRCRAFEGVGSPLLLFGRLGEVNRFAAGFTRARYYCIHELTVAELIFEGKIEGWRSIAKSFNEKFPSVGFSKNQIQEKEKELKGSYKAIRDARKQSGAGWNENMCMIIAEPDLWKKLVDDNSKLKKFRTKPFPLFNYLATLYEGSIATGDLNFTSTEAPQQPTLRTEPVVPIDIDAPDTNLNPISANQELQGASSSHNLDEEEPAASTCSGQKDDNVGKKRKQSQVAGVLQNYLDFKKKQSIKFMDELDETSKPKDDYSIKKCMDVLDSIEELSDEEKAMATNVFKCEVNREIFINFKKPTVRLIWLKSEIAPK
ncbi:hypothetical protein ACP70R_001680 [Stipagrostis hirtigluma subsp. patula]